MLRSSLFWKLFGGSVVLIAAFVTAFVVLVTPWQQQQIERQLARRLEDNALLLGSQTSILMGRTPAEDLRGELQRLVEQLSRDTELRLTIVAADGTVVADSHRDPATMENHGAREEVLMALREGVGRTRRVSPTMGFSMMYVARRIGPAEAPQGTVRVAVPTAPLDAQVAATRGVILHFAGVFTMLALALAFFISARIVRPLIHLTQVAEAAARGDYRPDLPSQNRPEFGPLFGALQQLEKQLAKGVDEVRRQAQQLETVLGGMVEGVVAIDAQRRVLFANQAARKLLGHEAAPHLARFLWELVRHPAVEQAVSEALAHNESRRCEFELLQSTSRQTVALQVSCLPGQPCPGLVLVFNDVTELRKLERLRREFIANVSHELKTPLSSIKAYSETLLAGAIHDHEHNLLFLERIHAQAQRLEKILLDMLSLSRIESGQLPLEIVPLPLRPLVDELLLLHAAEAQRKAITLLADPPDDDMRVLADEEALREILENLLGNAIKYTPEGGRVTVRWRREAPSVVPASAGSSTVPTATGNPTGAPAPAYQNSASLSSGGEGSGSQQPLGTIVIQVEDTGLGIAEADQERIFERFFRVDRARSRELGGTGLGLSIVKHLAQALGGSVGVKSQLGKGSLFFVKLREGTDDVQRTGE